MATTTHDDNPALARPGPVQPDGDTSRNAAPTIGDTLLTVLLVIYPALGALGLIGVGLLLAGVSA
ncbi:hypothetical protein [Mesorhizobium sp. ANAO-SY3R2]|uniref:hypothetical protein n=1 Tax=Mesorhizobium sp. ANAO-SY3R2 TaxID=3166644 RepID=UPI00366AAC82